MALDGVYLDAPRAAQAINLVPAMRVDVAVACSSPGTFYLASSEQSLVQAVLVLSVAGAAAPPPALPAAIGVARPGYLTDLSGLGAASLQPMALSLSQARARGAAGGLMLLPRARLIRTPLSFSLIVVMSPRKHARNAGVSRTVVVPLFFCRLPITTAGRPQHCHVSVNLLDGFRDGLLRCRPAVPDARQLPLQRVHGRARGGGGRVPGGADGGAGAARGAESVRAGAEPAPAPHPRRVPPRFLRGFARAWRAPCWSLSMLHPSCCCAVAAGALRNSATVVF